jgi:hypothetical protein
MNWSIISSGPYMQMLNELFLPRQSPGSSSENPSYVFTLPISEKGAMPLIDLEDLGRYSLWAFDNPKEASGMLLEISTVHASGPDLASAFTATTGFKCDYVRADMEEFLELMFGNVGPQGKDTVIGGETLPNGQKKDPDLQTWAEDFRAWWKIYEGSGENKGIIQRDYALLDRILPDRVKSVEEWMKKTGYRGEFKPVLKDAADRAATK